MEMFLASDRIIFVIGTRERERTRNNRKRLRVLGGVGVL